MAEQQELQEGWDEIEELYGRAMELLTALDRLQLYQAGAHLTMAMEAIRQRHPNLPPPE